VPPGVLPREYQHLPTPSASFLCTSRPMLLLFPSSAFLAYLCYMCMFCPDLAHEYGMFSPPSLDTNVISIQPTRSASTRSPPGGELEQRCAGRPCQARARRGRGQTTPQRGAPLQPRDGGPEIEFCVICIFFWFVTTFVL
jgi:hypothetical protein